MSAPCAGIHPSAVIGQPAEHRDFRANYWSRDEGVFPTNLTMALIHPTALIEALVTVDAGITSPTIIGPEVWLMKRVHVGHDAVIGAFCELAPGTVIGGHAVLGESVRCGINVSVRPGVHIGDGARLGAGAVVVKDVPPGETWVGNPARELRKQVTGGDVLIDEARSS